jgi:hypothetical protein
MTTKRRLIGVVIVAVVANVAVADPGDNCYQSFFVIFSEQVFIGVSSTPEKYLIYLTRPLLSA